LTGIIACHANIDSHIVKSSNAVTKFTYGVDCPFGDILIAGAASFAHGARQAPIIACRADSTAVIVVASDTAAVRSDGSEMSCRALGAVIVGALTSHASNTTSQANNLIYNVVISV
jgi:hypothetical protein